MKKLFTLLMAVLMFASIHTTSVFADDSLSCSMTKDGTKYTIQCNSDIFNASSNTNFTLQIGSMEIELRYALVAGEDGTYATFYEEDLIKSQAYGQAAPEGTYVPRLIVNIYGNPGGPIRKSCDLTDANGMYFPQIKKEYPDGLKVSFDNTDYSLNITCAENDACKDYLQTLLNTSVLTNPGEQLYEFDNSVVALDRMVQIGGENHFPLPSFKNPTIPVFINESVDDYELKVTKDILLQQVDASNIGYRASVNVIGYTKFEQNETVTVNIPKASLGEISATVSQEETKDGDLLLVFEFSNATDEAYINGLNELTYHIGSGNSASSYGMGFEKGWIDLANKRLVIPYEKYYNLKRGEGKFELENNEYEALFVNAVLERTSYGEVPNDLRFALTTEGIAVITTDKAFLESLTNGTLINELPEKYRLGRLSMSNVFFGRVNNPGGFAAAFEPLGKKVLEFKEYSDKIEYCFTIPFEEVKGEVGQRIQYVPEATLALNIPLYNNHGSIAKNIKSWYDMSIMLEEMLDENSGSTATDEDLQDAIKDAGIDLKSEVTNNGVSNVGVESYLAQIIDIENKNGKGFSQEDLGEGGRVVVTVNVLKSTQNLVTSGSDENDEVDVSKLEDTGLVFEIDILNKYFADQISEVPSSEEEIKELIFPIELLLGDLPIDELEEDEEFQLLTEHNGVKKTIPIQIVGSEGKVKIKEFSPFQLVIGKNTVDPSGGTANTSRCYFDGDKIRCSGGSPVFNEKDVSIHFVSGKKDYVYHIDRSDMHDPFEIDLKAEYLYNSKHSDTLPAGSYTDIYLELHSHSNYNDVTWYKLGFRNEPFAYVTNGLLSVMPDSSRISVEEDGEGGLNIRCISDDDTECYNYLSSVKNSETTHVSISDKNDPNKMYFMDANANSVSGNSSLFTENADKTFNISNFTLTSSNSFETFENKDVVLSISNVGGYVGKVNKDVLDFSIPAGAPGTFVNPYKTCRLDRNVDADDSAINAFVASCSEDGNLIFSDDFQGPEDNRSLYLVQKDEQGNETGKTFTLFLNNAVLKEDKLYFDNSSFMETRILDKEHNNTYLPEGNYDVYLEKMNQMGQGGSGIYYLLSYEGNTNNPTTSFERIKNPAPNFTVQNDDENNIRIACADGDAECSKWLGFIYDEINSINSERKMAEIIFHSQANETIEFSRNSNAEILQAHENQAGEITALVIPGNRLASLGFKSINGSIPMNYRISISAYSYMDGTQEKFTPNVTLKDPRAIMQKLEISQDATYPFDFKVSASDQEAYDYLKAAVITPHDSSDGLSKFGKYENPNCDDQTMTCTYRSLFSEIGEEVNVILDFASAGYEDIPYRAYEDVLEVDMHFIHTKEIAHSKIIFATSGIQIFSDDVNFLKTLTGEIEADYPNKFGMELAIMDNTYKTVAIISDNFIYGKEVQNDKTINYLDPNTNTNYPLSYYVQVDNPELAEINFDSTKSYIFEFAFPYDYNFGNIKTSPISISNEYFRGLAEGGYTEMTDEENLNILGVILGVDATDNNPNTIKKIYKEISKDKEVDEFGVDMPEVVGAIVERENEMGGFSKENIQYLGANEVQLGIDFTELEEDKLQEGFKKFDVEKTDVGFEVTLTNRYFKDGVELTDKADNITELPKEVEMTFNLPSEDLEEGKEYMLLTIHNGNVKLLPIKVEKDANGNKVGKALVSEFSPFQVVVKETNTPTKPSTNGGYVVVNTGVK